MQPAQGNSNFRFSSEEQQNLFNKHCIELDNQTQYCQILENSLQRKELSPSFSVGMVSMHPSTSETDLSELNAAYEKLNLIKARIFEIIKNQSF